MMHLYIVEFCNPLGFKNKKDNRYARIRILDDRNRVNGEFVIPRSCLTKETSLGDELILVNKTKDTKK